MAVDKAVAKFKRFFNQDQWEHSTGVPPIGDTAVVTATSDTPYRPFSCGLDLSSEPHGDLHTGRQGDAIIVMLT